MIKLLKYEFLRTFKPFVIVSVMFVVGLVPMIAFRNEDGLLFDIGAFLAVISIFGFIAVQIMFVINTFWKNLFGARGTLIFSLPLSVDSILMAKILNGIILLTATSLLLFLAIMVAASSGSISEFWYILRTFRLPTTDLDFMYLVIFSFVFSVAFFLVYASFLTQILFVTALLNSMRVQKYIFIKGFLLYIAISLVFFLISLVSDALNVILCLIFIPVFYFWSRRLIIKKLELLK